MVTAPPKPQEVDPAEVAGMAATAAEHLQTGYHAIYRDERVNIALDTFVPNISVRVFFSGRRR